LLWTFFEEALEKWLHFGAESVEGEVSTSERNLAWIETMNDFNDGALGGWQRAARDDTTDTYYNRKIQRNDHA
jgi:hypothetical protein